MNLVSLQFITSKNFQNNLDTLVSLIDKTKVQSFILAPELCLTGYAYESLAEASALSNKAINVLKKLSYNKTISLTMTIKKDNNFYNTLFIFKGGNILHTQSKYQLFTLGEEEKYFTKGSKEDIKVIDIDGLKVACLICFELRFIELWAKVQGADLILLPAMWGKLRRENFITLTNALAVANECYVLASSSPNDDMAKASGIVSPFGLEFRSDEKEIIEHELDFKEIKKMRKYLNVGIK